MPVETIPFLMGVNRPERYNNLLTVSGTDRFSLPLYGGGNYYALGTTSVVVGLEPFIVRHTPFGEVIWAKRIVTGSLPLFTGHLAGGVDSNGDLIVLFGINTTTYGIMKINAAGVIQWQVGYSDGTTALLNNNPFLALDPSGNPVALLSHQTPAPTDTVLKLSGTDGTETWQRAIDNPNSTNVALRGVSVDSSDRPIVTGGWDSLPDEAAVIRLNSDGTNSAAASFTGDIIAADVMAAPDNSIYAALDDVATTRIVKFNSAMVFQWGRSYSLADLRHLAIVRNGANIIVAGDDNTDGWLASLDSSGTEVAQLDVAGVATSFRGVNAAEDAYLLLGAATSTDAYISKMLPDLSNPLDGNGVTYTAGSRTQSVFSPTITTPTVTNTASTAFTRSTPTLALADVPFTSNLITGF